MELYGCSFSSLLLHTEGFRIPVLPKAEFDRLVWSDIICSSLRGRGEDSAGLRSDLDRCILSTSGAWNHGTQAISCGLKKAYVSQDR